MLLDPALMGLDGQGSDEPKTAVCVGLVTRVRRLISSLSRSSMLVLLSDLTP
jgi:hypothetical protein